MEIPKSLNYQVYIILDINPKGLKYLQLTNLKLLI